MGERIIRPGIRTSEKVAANIKNGGFMAGVFFDWLLTLVDDYGRYDARPAILRPSLFPLMLDLVREADVQRCLDSCAAAGLIRLYQNDGKPYLEIINFRQRLRAEKSKWPSPNQNVTTVTGRCHDNCVTMPIYTETETETDNNMRVSISDFKREALEIYSAYPRKVSKPRAIAAICKALKTVPPAVLLEKTKAYHNAVIGHLEEQFIPHPATWFNQERYNDEPKTWAAKSRPTKPKTALAHNAIAMLAEAEE